MNDVKKKKKELFKFCFGKFLNNKYSNLIFFDRIKKFSIQLYLYIFNQYVIIINFFSFFS